MIMQSLQDSIFCKVHQESAILYNNLQIARFSRNLQYSTSYLIAQELKVLELLLFTLTSSESFVSLQFRNKRHVKKKIPFSFDAHIVNWLYAASTHFTARAKALQKESLDQLLCLSNMRDAHADENMDILGLISLHIRIRKIVKYISLKKIVKTAYHLLKFVAGIEQ